MNRYPSWDKSWCLISPVTLPQVDAVWWFYCIYDWYALNIDHLLVCIFLNGRQIEFENVKNHRTKWFSLLSTLNIGDDDDVDDNNSEHDRPLIRVYIGFRRNGDRNTKKKEEKKWNEMNKWRMYGYSKWRGRANGMHDVPQSSCLGLDRVQFLTEWLT